MAVYKRAYRPYAGTLTPAWSRFLVLPRYAFETLFRSRFLTSYFVLCFVPAIVAAGIIYLWNTPPARLLLGGPADNNSVPFAIDGRFFYYLLRMQSGMAFLFAAWVGPDAGGSRSRQQRAAAVPVPARSRAPSTCSAR